jgi:protein O-GlcNAc transferase
MDGVAQELAQIARLQEQGDHMHAVERTTAMIEHLPGDWRPLLLRALARQATGDRSGALDDLRQTTRLAPQQVEAWLQLGELQLALGERSAALDAARAASRLTGRDTAVQFRVGTLLDRAGSAAEAEQVYHRVLAAAPSHVPALNNLASLERARGALAPARERLERVVAIDPAFEPGHLNLAAVLAAADDDPASEIACLVNGLQHCPRSVALCFRLGLARLRAADLLRAEAAFRQVLDLDPRHVDALNNLGTIRLREGEPALARALLEQALAIAPGHAAALSNLGSSLLMLGHAQEAAQAYAGAVEADARLDDGWLGMGVSLLELGQPEPARRCIAQALTLSPTRLEVHLAMAKLLAQIGDLETARAHFDAAYALQPSLILDVRRSLMLSPVHASVQGLQAERARFEREVERLIAAPGEITETDLLNHADTWFYLAYQGCNDRALRMQLAHLLSTHCPALDYVSPHVLATRDRSRPIRIGFVGRFFHNHSVGRFFNPVIEALAVDDRFEVVVFLLDPRRDALVEQLIARPLRSIDLPGWSLEKAREQIESQSLDILVYPEIGMDPFTWLLAFSRLARLQCVLQGHSVTTGIPTIDCFISSELIEPADAQSQFSEQLAQLPGLPMVLDPLPRLPPPLARSELGIDEDVDLYLCPMKLQKVHPAMDAAVAQILRGNPRARVAFMQDDTHPNWHAIVEGRMRVAMPDVCSRLLFLPWMRDSASFIRLLRTADVILDSFHHGGATTAHLCLASGRAVVAWRSGTSRAGFIDGYYRLLGVTGCMADTPEQYVEIALRLTAEPAWRTQIETAIGRGLPALYRPEAVCAAYADLLFKLSDSAEPARLGQQYRPMRTGLQHAEQMGAPFTVLEPAQPARVHPPQVVGAASTRAAVDVELPAVYVAELRAMVAVGGESCLLDAEHDAVVDELGARDPYVRYALPNCVYRRRAGTHVVLQPMRAADRRIEKAIWLCGRASNNYYHWLTEYLPRLAGLSRQPQYAGWPVLIDAGLHANLLQALRRCLPPGHALIEVANGEQVAVERILVLGPRAWMPIDMRAGIPAIASDMLFAPSAVSFLRSRLGRSSPAVPRRRLFLRRGRAAYRTLLNEDAVEQAMVECGFEVVRPETLSLDQQIDLFSEAQVVVGATGAAFGNMVFAPPGCRVLVLYYDGVPMQYFSNLAQVLDIDLHYLFGRPVRGSHPIAYQCDFAVDPQAVRAAIDQVMAIAHPARHGFLLHIPEIVNHMRPIWQRLPAGSFEVINAGEGEDALQIAALAAAESVPCVPVEQRLQSGLRSPVLISNHPIDPSGVPLIKRLGRINVRLMYALGKAGWNQSAWNALYDAVLCFGPYHVEALAGFPAVKLQVGQPRFDAFDALLPERERWLARHGCDPSRRTVVWLPTWKDLSSVGVFDDAVAALCERHNVVVKLHPLMSAQEPDKVAALRALGLNTVIADCSDNLPLYVIADWVLCDYGGPAFGALLTDRNLLLLDRPDAQADPLVGADSPDLRLRESVCHVDADARWQIAGLLEDDALWAQQREVRRLLRQTYFAPYRGCAAELSAACLRNIETIVRDGQG